MPKKPVSKKSVSKKPAPAPKTVTFRSSGRVVTFGQKKRGK